MCVRPGTKDRIVASQSVPTTAPRTGTVSVTNVSVTPDSQVSGRFKGHICLLIPACPSVSLFSSVMPILLSFLMDLCVCLNSNSVGDCLDRCRLPIDNRQGVVGSELPAGRPLDPRVLRGGYPRGVRVSGRGVLLQNSGFSYQVRNILKICGI